MKLHFGNSWVDYHNPRHLEQVKGVFRAANGYGMAIVVHMRANTSQKMGREEALLFLDELLPAAPDVTVQIAHLGGAGGVEASINNVPRLAWAAFRKLPLTAAEFRAIENNVPAR